MVKRGTCVHTETVLVVVLLLLFTADHLLIDVLLLKRMQLVADVRFEHLQNTHFL
jgi:hypothetical protein